MSELAEGARLEIACATNSGTEGSNPSLSAIAKTLTQGKRFSKTKEIQALLLQKRNFPDN
jgi:hypothetical protein